MQTRFSKRVTDLKASPIRDILEVIDRPGMVSFAGGLPSAESFPDLSHVAIPRKALQYGATEGEIDLREQIASELSGRGLQCTTDQILILNGSQQGIDLVAKLFIDGGRRVAVESPTYLAALQVFRFFGAQFEPFNPSADGELAAAFHDCAFAYVIPNFQNPTGRCFSSQIRERLAIACDSSETPLFEDDPYRDLVYEDCDRSPVCARLERASWIYQGSFSKSFAPGLRLGYLACSSDLVRYFVRLKQAADLHSNRISQWLILQQLSDPGREARLNKLRDDYRAKRDHFNDCLKRTFAQSATWEVPPGGLFFWLRLNSEQRIDTRTLFAPAIERSVAFMPGEPFFADEDTGIGTMRLNFSHASHDDVERGLAVLAELVQAQMIATR
ncbi:MAG: PLP-dependent aminotransferase family protein [Proteobacteria bacterium]|nr:PLP-dependent aminotransferase family protein [Pseudomonadota bacterium]